MYLNTWCECFRNVLESSKYFVSVCGVWRCSKWLFLLSWPWSKRSTAVRLLEGTWDNCRFSRRYASRRNIPRLPCSPFRVPLLRGQYPVALSWSSSWRVICRIPIPMHAEPVWDGIAYWVTSSRTRRFASLRGSGPSAMAIVLSEEFHRMLSVTMEQLLSKLSPITRNCLRFCSTWPCPRPIHSLTGDDTFPLFWTY